jgi:hypothetical protein
MIVVIACPPQSTGGKGGRRVLSQYTAGAAAMKQWLLAVSDRKQSKGGR